MNGATITLVNDLRVNTPIEGHRFITESLELHKFNDYDVKKTISVINSRIRGYKTVAPHMVGIGDHINMVISTFTSMKKIIKNRY